MSEHARAGRDPASKKAVAPAKKTKPQAKKNAAGRDPAGSKKSR